MPTYDYKCNACGHAFEHFQSMKDKPMRRCPDCRKLALERLIGIGAAVMFKGSGFYQTDYRSEGYKKAAEADRPGAGADAKGGDTKAGETKAESAKPTGEGSGAKEAGKGETPKEPSKGATSTDGEGSGKKDGPSSPKPKRSSKSGGGGGGRRG